MIAINKTERQSKRALSLPEALRARALHWTSWMLLIVIVFFAAVRFHWRGLPLERDEGEYAYCGQLILQGIPPYQLAYNMKFPGTYAAYALMMAVFGQTSSGIHLGFILVNIAATVLVFLLGRKLYGSPVGAVSAVAYVVLSASNAVLGLAAHATHFVVLAALAGILSLLLALEADRPVLYFCSGTCVGLAYLMKQPGIVFALFGFVYFAYRKWNRRGDMHFIISRGGALLAGTIWPVFVLFLFLIWRGVFQRFWFWTFMYARAYGGYITFHTGFQQFRTAAKSLLRFDGGIWLLAVVGFILLFLDRKSRTHAEFLIALLALSFLGVCPGFFFRPHYFVLILPAAALLCGSAVVHTGAALRERRSKGVVLTIPVLVFVLAVILSVLREHAIFFAPDSNFASRRIYPLEPFVEAEEVAAYLKSVTSPDTRLAIFGSEPEIYFECQRHSATGYIYTYSLMEQQKYALQMREQMLTEVEMAQPQYVLFVDDHSSWGWSFAAVQEDFFRRVLNYINTEYEKAAELKIEGGPDHRMGESAAFYIFRRRTAAKNQKIAGVQLPSQHHNIQNRADLSAKR